MGQGSMGHLVIDSLKEVGSIEPIRCTIQVVHIYSDYISAFCELSSEFHRYVYSIYEKQKPFDLLSLILLFDIKYHYRYVDSQLSEASNCFYIHYFWKEVWRIGIDDHVVTTFLSTNFGIQSLAISPNGQLFILDRSSPFRIHIYAADGSPAGVIDLSFLYGQPCAEIGFPLMYRVPTIVYVGGDNILMADSKCDNLVHKSWIGFWSINKLKHGMKEGRFIWKQEKLHQKRLVVRLPMNYIEEPVSYSSDLEWAEVTKNDEGILTYFELFSNTTKNVSNDDCLGEIEVLGDLSFVTVNIDRNMGFVCKDRIELGQFENWVYKKSAECYGSHSKTQSEMILIYKCLNQTSWCQKTVETMQSRLCPRYVTLHKSKGNLFIKPSSMYSYSNKLMIYTIQ